MKTTPAYNKEMAKAILREFNANKPEAKAYDYMNDSKPKSMLPGCNPSLFADPTIIRTSRSKRAEIERKAFDPNTDEKEAERLLNQLLMMK